MGKFLKKRFVKWAAAALATGVLTFLGVSAPVAGQAGQVAGEAAIEVCGEVCE